MGLIHLLKETNYINERMMLIKYEDYAKAVTEAYKARPVKDTSVVLKSWDVLRESNEKMFKRLSAVVDVVWTTDDPYHSQKQMKDEVKETGKLYINTDYSKNLLSGWSEEENWKFRAVHDFIVHIGGDVDFSQKGEIQAFNVHAKIAPPDSLDALFSEIVGQASFVTVTGDFPDPQKASKLYGFDYDKVGNIHWDDYRLNFTENPIKEYTDEEINKIIKSVRVGEIK